jgi:hypothetical protein
VRRWACRNRPISTIGPRPAVRCPKPSPPAQHVVAHGSSRAALAATGMCPNRSHQPPTSVAKARRLSCDIIGVVAGSAPPLRASARARERDPNPPLWIDQEPDTAAGRSPPERNPTVVASAGFVGNTTVHPVVLSTQGPASRRRRQPGTAGVPLPGHRRHHCDRCQLDLRRTPVYPRPAPSANRRMLPRLDERHGEPRMRTGFDGCQR